LRAFAFAALRGDTITAPTAALSRPVAHAQLIVPSPMNPIAAILQVVCLCVLC